MQNWVPAYVLHSRPYRETSLLLDVLSAEQGRISLVARGARGAKSPWRAVLQPFVPLLMSWAGQGELATLRGAEARGLSRLPGGQGMLCGFYLNELLTRLLQRQDAQPEVFAAYEACLSRLCVEPAEPVLRAFELELLDAMGYGAALDCDERGADLAPGAYYRYWSERGLAVSERREPGLDFPAEHLLAIARRDFSDAEVLRAAKFLSRQLLAPLLGNKPLRSRELFLRKE
ncbi:MAG: DNA repair protein RecO [Gammaproteobacteria bacterium]|nr:DNA repair protein RecO [Gammaproteobacteria bacterium]